MTDSTDTVGRRGCWEVPERGEPNVADSECPDVPPHPVPSTKLSSDQYTSTTYLPYLYTQWSVPVTTPFPSPGLRTR